MVPVKVVQVPLGGLVELGELDPGVEVLSLLDLLVELAELAEVLGAELLLELDVVVASLLHEPDVVQIAHLLR